MVTNGGNVNIDEKYLLIMKKDLQDQMTALQANATATSGAIQLIDRQLADLAKKDKKEVILNGRETE